MFYDQFYALCQDKGVIPAKVAESVGVNKSTMYMWKKQGTTPKYDTLQKLADYFGVSVDYLLGKTSNADRDGSIRVHVSPEQREYGELMKKYADETITDAEMRRLSELQAKQPPLEESMKKLTGTLERMRKCLLPLNEAGQQKVIEHAEAYAWDLAEIPRYRAETTPQSTPAPQEDKDTTPPQAPPETPPEGE